MSREPIAPQKYNPVSKGRRKLIVKILVMKKNSLKNNSQKKDRIVNQTAHDPLSFLRQEMEQNIQEVYRNKTKIEKLTKSTKEELMKIHQLSSKAEALEEKHIASNKKGSSTKTTTMETGTLENNHNGFGLEYELANMKMIRKILNLAVPFETDQCEPKKEKKTRKKPSKRERKVKFQEKRKEAGATTKILIVEDDRTTIKIISYLLEQHSYKVFSAMDVEEGLKMVFREMPDLVLLDIMLPGMDGFQLLKKLRANQQTSRIPVIILSSLSGEKDVLKGLERGATDYILKPFSPQILFFKIKKILAFQNERIACSRNL